MQIATPDTVTAILTAAGWEPIKRGSLARGGIKFLNEAIPVWSCETTAGDTIILKFDGILGIKGELVEEEHREFPEPPSAPATFLQGPSSGELLGLVRSPG